MAVKNKVKIFLGSLCVVAILFYFLFGRAFGPPMSPFEAEKKRLRSVLEKDKLVVLDPKSPPFKAHGSLVRLAQFKESMAREESIRRSGSADPLVRSMAAEAIGHFEDKESEKTLWILAKDKERGVRLSALEGLGRRYSPARKLGLQSYIRENSLDSSKGPETFMAHYALFSMGGAESEKDQTMSKLFEVFKRLSGSEKMVAVRYLGAIALSQKKYRDPFLQMAKMDVLQTGEPELVAWYFQTLDRFLASEIQPLIDTVLQSSKNSQKIGLFEALPIICKENRFKWIELTLKKPHEPDTVIRAAERALMSMPSASSLQILEMLLAAGIRKNRYGEWIQALKKSDQKDPCVTNQVARAAGKS